MTLRLMGANPCVTLYDDGRATAYASVWRVDWSLRGSGRALVLGTPDRIRIIGPDATLSTWLGAEFNRHLKSVSAGIGWSEPELAVAPVEFDLDLSEGLRASAADVTVEITAPIDRFLTRNDEYDLGGTPNILSTVWIPCRHGAISVGGTRLAGEVTVDATAPMSSAFIADAEVWCTTDHPRK
ncbi:hypothetical protein BWI15_16475 [Kribbella sp. ALI-6-A]|uniref:hypothetical protein n=1 Tax=Kribbella sp. ALI-6-A TaxID=1933817 RepID=UPI00097C3977|nr:hypothetical protein [Kribbella sp. ALI-6-A]ONI71740.1 hypothetical protein BWI15_16475 [Kribbella sp. ALI-6-A]